MKPGEFTCFPRFHTCVVLNSLKRAGRYQRKLIREYRSLVEEMHGRMETVIDKGPFRLYTWSITNQACCYGGVFVLQYTMIGSGPKYQFRSEVIVEEVKLHEENN